MQHPPRPDLSSTARAAVRGLAGLRLLGLGSLAAASMVWWLVLGPDTLAGPGRAALAAVAGIVLAAPGLLLLHFEWSLRRAALMVAELVDRNATGERFDGPPGLFMRSMRLAMRRRGIGVLAAPWYWLAGAWAFGASVVLILGALALVVAALW